LQYLENKGISKYEFYQKTGVSNGILSQKNGINEENILRFLNYFDDISPDWLLTGKGEMLRCGDPPTAPTNPNECASSQNNLTPQQTNSNVTSLISILQDTLKEKDHQIDRLLSIIEHNNLTPPNK